MSTHPVDTGLKDRDGNTIFSDDLVSYDGIMTADDSLGSLPNGWTFEESDVYKVYFDTSIEEWSVDAGIRPDTPYNVKLLNHLTELLHEGEVLKVDPVAKKPLTT